MPRSPVPEEIRRKYIQEGLKLRSEGKSQPDLEYNGRSYYLDNKGNGTYGLNDRAVKYANEAARRAGKLNATPKLSDYIEAYGPELGKKQYAIYREQMRRIYNTVGTPNMDVDHMNSLADGGIEHFNNLRLQNSSKNRSEGARKLPLDKKNGLMVANSIRDQILMQGPRMTPLQRQMFLAGQAIRRGGAYGGNILMAIGPDLMEIADSKTNGAISNGINGAVDAGKDLIVNGINGWSNILTSMVGQENRERATNYGQY